MGNYLSPLNTKLDADQVLRRAYDEAKNMLRVDAQVSASIGNIILSDTTSSISIGDGSGDRLTINSDGSINTNVQNITITATSDSIKIGDGTYFLAINPDGSINVAGVATAANQTNGTQRTQITNGTNNAGLLNAAPVGTEYGLVVRNIPSGVQDVNVASFPLPVGAATEATLQTVATNTTSIDTKFPTQGQKTMSGSLPVVLASDQSPIPVTFSNTTLAPVSFDDVKIIRDSSSDPIQYQFYLSAVSVGNINVIYDADKNPIEYKRV